jgi:hypothetical protein
MTDAIEKKPIKTKGGARPNSGRKKGSPNKISSEIRAIAQQHGEKAIAMLAEMMLAGESESARIAAAKEILDRAYGKASQLIEGPGANGEHLFKNTAAAPQLPKEEWLKAHGIDLPK